MRLLQSAAARAGTSPAVFQDKTRIFPLHFSAANLAGMKVSQPFMTLLARESTATSSASAGLFGSLVRQQIPSGTETGADSEGQREPATKAPAEENLTSGESIVPGWSAHAQAMPTQPVRCLQESDTSMSFTVPPAEEENATATEIRSSDSEIPGAEARGAARRCCPPNSASETPVAPIPAARSTATSEPGPLISVQAEERADGAGGTTTPKDRKSETVGKEHAAKSDHAPSSPLRSDLSPDANTAQVGSSVVPSPASSSASGSDHGEPSALNGGLGVRISQGNLPSTQQRSGPSAAENLTNHLGEAAGATSPGGAGVRAATHNTSGNPTAASPQRASDVFRPGAGVTADGQHAHPSAGPALAPIAGAQAAQVLQTSGSVHSAVTAHPSGAASDPSLRPTTAFERMDAAEPPRVLENSPQKLTVGIRDSGLGWIEIRTNAVAGQVAATLASGTREAHAAIAAALPSIRDALTTQHVALHSLNAERFPASSGGGGSAANTSDSGSPVRQPFVSPKGEVPSASEEEEAENLSYISVRV